MFFPGGACGVALMADTTGNALALVKRLRLAGGYYSFDNQHGALFPVWIDEPVTITDKIGFPTADDCKLAASDLAGAKIQATINVIANNDKYAVKDPCYVEVIFKDDKNFEAFFSSDLLHSFHKKDGFTSMVRVHAMRSPN
jgi:hypothetical protein